MIEIRPTRYHSGKSSEVMGVMPPMFISKAAHTPYESKNLLRLLFFFKCLIATLFWCIHSWNLVNLGRLQYFFYLGYIF